MKYTRFSSLVAIFFLSLPVIAQSNAAPGKCPVTFVHFDPSAISTRIQNTSGKTIVGLTFYAALADATEHWKWYHYDFDDSRPLREFGWNKEIKPMASKTLSWGADLDFEHGGGGAFVLTSALFSDGASWEETPSGSSCKVLWFNSHKKSFARPVELPARQH